MPDVQRIKNKGFTLIEIMIAAGLMSLFMTGVFMLYRSGSKAFVAGSWRLDEQKRLQNFLGALSRDIGMASPGLLRIESDGSHNIVINTPFYINSNLLSFNSPPVFMPTNTADWTCLLAFSISYPYIDANATFSTPISYGRWSGVSVWTKNRKIKYVRTGDPVTFSDVPAMLPGAVVGFPDPAIVGAGLDFLPDPELSRNITYDLSLEQMAIVATGTDLMTLGGFEITCRSARYEGGTRTEADMLQSIVVRIASQTNVVTF
ncbi:MAG: hypothetical protein A2W80_15415 [Candidatus Riflebacteria bacterium GWC2_50_8]|nr:MAG: hypothetical protein A2W80_15415 [Candidatus Riflebacteria bacterium GWC2_50_8]